MKMKYTTALSTAAVLALTLTGCEDDAAPAEEEPTTEAAAEEETSPETEEGEETEEAEDPAPEEEAGEDLTSGQRNAVRSAESYISFSGFSRTGLIEQLEFEDYSREDAEFAVDLIEVDWNEQAVRSAESYLEFTSFSEQGLIDQLIFEGYTEEQARYGAEQAY